MKKITIIVLFIYIAVSATACSQHTNTASESSLSVSHVSEPTSELADGNDNESTQSFSSEHFAEIIKKPDTIICYVNGAEKTIELGQQTDEIFELSQVALSERVGQYGLAYEESDIAKAKEKGTVLEFLYDNPISAEWKYKPDYSVKYEYSSMAIVIDGGGSSLSKMVIVGSGTPTPIGDFIASDDLMRIIRDIAPESQQSSISSEVSISSSNKSEVLQQQSSVSAQEEFSTSSKTPELVGYVKDNQYNLYSKIVSCSIENDVMTVIFSAYAENPINADVSMDVWMSSDNGAGDVYEMYSIDKLKEYHISMSSFWFDQTGTYKGMSYEVNVTIATTRHTFYLRDGKVSF